MIWKSYIEKKWKSWVVYTKNKTFKFAVIFLKITSFPSYLIFFQSNINECNNLKDQRKRSNLQSAVSKALIVETVIDNLRDLRYSYSSNAFCQFLAWNKHLPLVSRWSQCWRKKSRKSITYMEKKHKSTQ